jgi:hypothetical protein
MKTQPGWRAGRNLHSKQSLWLRPTDAAWPGWLWFLLTAAVIGYLVAQSWAVPNASLRQLTN